MTQPDLRQRLALVSGASRGVGRGIARVLAQAGATVVRTGRSVEDDEPGTLAIRCDHGSPEQVAALFERLAELGPLDLLVNNAWAGYEHYAGFMDPFWQQPIELRWQAMFVGGLWAHMLTSWHACRVMVPRGCGLIVSTLAWDRGKHLGALTYDVAKHATRRFIDDLALELRPHGVAALAVAPGFTRTEAVLAAPDESWPGGVRDLSITESPEYVGRGIARLAADPRVFERTGEVLLAGELAELYDFTDIDGRRIPAFRIP